MTSVPTPNYILAEDHIIQFDNYDFKTLKEGTFARPLSILYVPNHVKEQSYNKNFDATKEVYAYTNIGIVRVPLDKLVKV